MLQSYRDRQQAAEVLGAMLAPLVRDRDALVLALPRGGVPVGVAIAEAIGAPFDVMVVRKLGMPGNPEFAVGAIAAGGAEVLNEEAVYLVSPSTLEHVRQRERAELKRRERAYRGDRSVPPMAGRTVILVDDGLATGATMRAAVAAVRAHDPAEIIVAVPVAPRSTVALLEREADRVVCPMTPHPFFGVGVWYQDFRQVSDDEVMELIARAGTGA